MGLFTEEVEDTMANKMQYLVTCITLFVVFIGLSIFFIYIGVLFFPYFSIVFSMMAGGALMRAIDIYKEIIDQSNNLP